MNNSWFLTNRSCDVTMIKPRLAKPRKIMAWEYSFIISLPKIWVQDSQLSKGDYIDFQIDPAGNLILSPNRNKGENA